MPSLLLLRHAKAGRAPPGGSDFDRPLDEDGRREALRVGREIAARGWRPGRVLCSPARRTRETLAALLRPPAAAEPQTDFLRDLYDGMDEDYGGLLRAHGGRSEMLLVVGHSPAVRDTALALSAPGDPLRGLVEARFPTAALALVEFDGAWPDLRPGRGRLAAFIRPADLGA